MPAADGRRRRQGRWCWPRSLALCLALRVPLGAASLLRELGAASVCKAGGSCRQWSRERRSAEGCCVSKLIEGGAGAQLLSLSLAFLSFARSLYACVSVLSTKSGLIHTAGLLRSGAVRRRLLRLTFSSSSVSFSPTLSPLPLPARARLAAVSQPSLKQWPFDRAALRLAAPCKHDNRLPD